MRGADKPTNVAQCQQLVYARWTSWPIAHQCSRKAVRAGWCNQHHPDTVAKRQAKSQEKFDKAHNARALERYGPHFFDTLVRISEGHNDPRALATKVVREFRRLTG